MRIGPFGVASVAVVLGESFGHDRTYFLAINGRKVVDFLHGGYFPYQTSSGSLSLVSDVNRSLRTFIAGGFIELAANPQRAPFTSHRI